MNLIIFTAILLGLFLGNTVVAMDASPQENHQEKYPEGKAGEPENRHIADLKFENKDNTVIVSPCLHKGQNTASLRYELSALKLDQNGNRSKSSQSGDFAKGLCPSSLKMSLGASDEAEFQLKVYSGSAIVADITRKFPNKN